MNVRAIPRWISSAMLLSLCVTTSCGMLPARPLKALWQYTEQSSIAASAHASDNSAYILYDSGLLLRLGTQGKPVWRTQLPDANGAKWSSLLSTPAGPLYVGQAYSGTDVLCLNDSGVVQWRAAAHLDAAAAGLGGNTRPLAVDAKGDLAVSCGQAVVFFDPLGKQSYLADLPGYHGFRPAAVAPDGSIYYILAESLLTQDGKTPTNPGSKRSFLVRLDPTGQEQWRIEGDFLAAYCSLQIAPDGNLFSQIDRKSVNVYDPTGSLVWKLKANVVSGEPVVFSGNRVYAGGNDGLFACQLDGKRVWQCYTEGDIFHLTPATDGAFYCCEDRFTAPKLLVQLEHRFNKKAPQPKIQSSVIVISPNGGLTNRHYLGSTSVKVMQPLPGGAMLIQTGPGEVTAYSR